jgi:hypothetical protein
MSHKLAARDVWVSLLLMCAMSVHAMHAMLLHG